MGAGVAKVTAASAAENCAMPARGLSTWGEGIVAAAVGDLEMMTALLNGEYDDKRGVDLRTMRTSYADQDFLAPRGVHIAANQQLVEIAMERDHEAVVMVNAAQFSAQFSTIL